MTIAIRDPSPSSLKQAQNMIEGICTYGRNSSERADALRKSNHVVFNGNNLSAASDIERSIPSAGQHSIYQYFADKYTCLCIRVFFLYARQEDLEQAIREAAFGLMDNLSFRRKHIEREEV